MTTPLLTVRGLKTWFGTGDTAFRAVDGVDFILQRGQTFALLGESGCGKSMTALSLLRLNPQPASRIVAGEIIFEGLNLRALNEAQLEKIRGRRIAMIFQEPQSSLNPVLRIDQQLKECLKQHFKLSASACRQRVLELLDTVGIPDPESRLGAYPHQLSGGMKQRVMIAMALAGEPELLIADEPTTALDVTIQAQILALLKKIQRKTGMAILLISHDLGVVSQMADQIAVMYAGQIVETADRQTFFRSPKHPYTRKLFASLPSEDKRQHKLAIIQGRVPLLNQQFAGCRFVERCDRVVEHCRNLPPKWWGDQQSGVRCHLYDPAWITNPQQTDKQTLEVVQPDSQADGMVTLAVSALKIHFPIRKGMLQRRVGAIKAVDGVDLILRQGETLALVGESGCGKSTVGKGILQLVPITDGEVLFQGQALQQLSQHQLKPYRSGLQIIFQDPFSSMNPRMTVRQILAEGLLNRTDLKTPEQQADCIAQLIERVGLHPDIQSRYPHEFSGGQRQRICIARALAAAPQVIICDEPTSALDVSVQAQILNLLRDIQHADGLSFLFITHNIAVVDYLAHRIAVMYLGRIVEQGSREQVLKTPKHPYTQALLAAVPTMEKTQIEVPVSGELPSPANPPSGCHFHLRCPQVMPDCKTRYPDAVTVANGHWVKCHLMNVNEVNNNG